MKTAGGDMQGASGKANQVFTLSRWEGGGVSNIWKVVFDLPGEKVNKLSRRVMEEFDHLIPEVEAKVAAGEIGALVLFSGKAGNFVAGADIDLIRSAKSAEEAESMSRLGQKLLDRWEDLKVPTVAAVHGTALGGGCEMTLACTATVASNDSATKIGLPEVMLGFVPGMGGCVRLPRKVGLATALEMILTGKQLNGERAAKAGLVEACLPKENFEENALRWVTSNLKSLQSGKRLAKEPKLGGVGGAAGTVLEKTPFGRAFMLKKAREGVVSKTKGQYPAPLEAIEVLTATSGGYGPRLRGSDRDQAMQREAKAFGRLAVTDVSRNLVGLFFLTESVKKSKGVGEQLGDVAATVDFAAVLGAGVMGGGIAQLLAEKDITVRMKDLTPQALAAGMTTAIRIFDKQVKRKRITPRQKLQKVNHIAPILDYSGFGGVDLVIEAVIEKMDIKKAVFQELETKISDDCVVASNTSSLSISEMQKAFKKPERFAGMHFFNPVAKMPLIEVIRGEKSDDRAVSTVYQFSKRIGKTPIVVKDSPGFLVNRLLMPYLNEATYMLSEGAPIDELDRAMEKFGMPMGPMELIDEVGVDVGEKVAHILNDAFGERMAPAPGQGKVVAAGRLGKKNSKGLYVYEGKDGREKRLDPEIYKIIGIDPAPGIIGEETVIERCVLPMINEAARCLEEGVVQSAAEVDLGMIMGTGFPPFRGGLLRYADTLGAQRLVDRLRVFEKQVGPRFAPAPALVKMAEQGRRFYET
jgi:3-hydroxyacyl-CoA dehydrogenase/enoyl-CoA hydratase/3-hydroxybutyryl-CoA epimerase